MAEQKLSLYKHTALIISCLSVHDLLPWHVKEMAFYILHLYLYNSNKIGRNRLFLSLVVNIILWHQNMQVVGSNKSLLNSTPEKNICMWQNWLDAHMYFYICTSGFQTQNLWLICDILDFRWCNRTNSDGNLYNWLKCTRFFPLLKTFYDMNKLREDWKLTISCNSS